MMEIQDSVYQAFKAHVLADYPKEAVGLVVDGTYIPCINAAESPTTHFSIEPAALIAAHELGTLQAVLHSHTYGMRDNPYTNNNQPQWPSAADMTCWMQDDIPWGIVATDGEGLSEMVWMDDSEIAPLLERNFIHGVHDCYAVIRDYFRLNGIDLKNYARGYNWWEKGQDLYSSNFADAGFVQVSEEEATIGDACLMQVRSPVINHAAVITGDNTITHHLFHRLSEEDRLDKWKRVIVKYVRYKGTE